MKIMQVKAQVGQAETAAAEVLVLMHCEGEALAKQGAAPLDRALGGSLSKLVQSKEFEGKANEVLLYHTQDKVPAKRLVLVGLGKKNEVTLETIRQAMGSAAKRVRQAKVGSFAVVLPTVKPNRMSWIEVTQAMVEGAILGSYQFTVYRSEAASGQDVAEMRILAQQKDQLRQVTEGVRRGVATAEATVFVRPDSRQGRRRSKDRRQDRRDCDQGSRTERDGTIGDGCAARRIARKSGAAQVHHP
jgi:leucyl aminopeptidase